MKVLIGDSGVVGKTLSEKIHFDYKFNSKNIDELKKIPNHIDEIYLSCLPAQKWIVNQNKLKDLNNIMFLINTLSKFTFGNIILISTIDVYLDTKLKANEDTEIIFDNIHYGTNRLLFEMMVKQVLNYEDLKIFRLPGIFGKYIKKNVVFDLCYKNNLESININSTYQWYNLENLCEDIFYYSENFKNETIINLFTEPIETIDLIKLFNYENCGYVGTKTSYNYTTKLSKSGYISDNKSILKQLEEFKNGFVC